MTAEQTTTNEEIRLTRSHSFIAPHPEVVESRRAGTLREFIVAQIVCECGDTAIRAHMI